VSAEPRYRPAVKFRQIDKATLARLQTRDEADENPNAELEEDDDDTEEREETITMTPSQRNNDGHRTTFIVDPNIDLNAPALLDMISPDPIVTEKITATEQKRVSETLERKISVAEVFESHAW